MEQPYKYLIQKAVSNPARKVKNWSAETCNSLEDLVQYCDDMAFGKDSLILAQDTHDNIRWVPLSTVEIALQRMKEIKNG